MCKCVRIWHCDRFKFSDNLNSISKIKSKNNYDYSVSDVSRVGEAVNEMKSGKAPGLDGFPV